VDEKGEPMVVYHGTPHGFEAFSPGGAENRWGSSVYFSGSPKDVRLNYARSEGPDITARTERAAEQIESLHDIDPDDVFNAARDVLRLPEYNAAQDGKYAHRRSEIENLVENGDIEGLSDAIGEAITEQVARRWVEGEGAFRTIPVHLKMDNPVYLDPSGKKGTTTFEIETVWDDLGEEVIEETGSGIDLLKALDDEAVGWNAESEVESIKGDIMDDLLDGTLTAVELDEAVNSKHIYDPDTGDLAAGDFLKEVFRRLGHDGIVADAHHFFGPKRLPGGYATTGMEGVDKGTYHYMVFDPTQIKSATGNVGTYDPKDPRIAYGIAGAAAAADED
jgi:hypothetical protein